MTFRILTGYFERLEKTSSRISLIEILSELFSEVKRKDIARLVYLIQGRVAPFYEPIEIGMADKSVEKSIARAYAVDLNQVIAEYGKVGDLGKVAENLSMQKNTKSANLEVSYVFEKLLEIAKISGEGTVEKKIAALTGLLEKMNNIEAKHLLRIPLGTSRLGIGDPTILDAFASSKLGDRKKRKPLEEAYNRVSDLGFIGETLWSGGLGAVENVSVSVGRPIRSELCERLPNPEKVIEKMEIVNAQKKLDGFRVQVHKDGEHIRLFSRNLEETTAMFPEIVEGARKQIKAKSAILDSEAIGYNPASGEFLPFQETTQRRRKYDITELALKIPLKDFCFDILYKDGKSLIDEPLEKRLEILNKTVTKGEVFMVETGERVSDPNRLQILLDESISEGLEGLVLKRLDSHYEAGGRNFNWVKLKRHSAGELKDTIDCVILGYIYGRGKRALFGAGALLVGVYDSEKDEFVTVSKIGTGLTDEEWREIHQRADKISLANKPARVISLIKPSVWVKPEIVIEILADEITRSPIHTAGRDRGDIGYALRFPRLVRFRDDDKKAEDATTVKELIQMYNSQGKK